jgi:hypothetical protein
MSAVEPSSPASETPEIKETRTWKDLGEEIKKLATVVIYRDQGQESRPANIEAALKLLPVLEANCNKFPIPTVEAEYNGSVDFWWRNTELRSTITCTIDMGAKEEEIDMSVYLLGKGVRFRLLSFSPGNSEDEKRIIEGLQFYLPKVFP